MEAGSASVEVTVRVVPVLLVFAATADAEPLPPPLGGGVHSSTRKSAAQTRNVASVSTLALKTTLEVDGFTRIVPRNTA